jgi:predicted ATP-dependent protease
MAVENKTYNNVINFLARLGEYHDQIATVSVGDIYDINLEKMELFPLIHINPINVTTNESELLYNFQIFICDLVSEKDNWQTYQAQQLTKLVDPKNNEQQVYNQTLEIATDFIGMLRHSTQQSMEGVDDINFPVYFTQDQFTIEPFSERFDNLLCGQVFQIGIKVMNDFSTCTIPVTNLGAGY